MMDKKYAVLAVVVSLVGLLLLLARNTSVPPPGRHQGVVVHFDDLPLGHVSHNHDIKKKVILKEFQAPHLLFLSRSVFQPGQSAPIHSHTDMDEVFYVESGVGTFLIDGKPQVLQKSDTAYVSAHQTHDISNKGTEDLVLVYFGIRS